MAEENLTSFNVDKEISKSKSEIFLIAGIVVLLIIILGGIVFIYFKATAKETNQNVSRDRNLTNNAASLPPISYNQSQDPAALQSINSTGNNTASLPSMQDSGNALSLLPMNLTDNAASLASMSYNRSQDPAYLPPINPNQGSAV
jgi:ABC-type Na+ efflux pump permease subunit